MLQRHRLAEFHGPEQLAEAGDRLLRDPLLDAVLVHNVTERNIYSGWGGNLYEAIPHVASLDSVVHAWWKETYGDAHIGDSMQIVSVNNETMPFHIDGNANPVLGPLMMTIRHNDHPDQNRIFWVRRSRLRSHNVLKDADHISYSAFIANTLRVYAGFGHKAMTRVVQPPHSATLWMGHPYGSVHGVDTNKCTAAIAVHGI